jgi:hypothetical protein
MREQSQIGIPQTLNLYSYVENNPVTGVDPDGHECFANGACNALSNPAGVQHWIVNGLSNTLSDLLSLNEVAKGSVDVVNAETTKGKVGVGLGLALIVGMNAITGGEEGTLEKGVEKGAEKVAEKTGEAGAASVAKYEVGTYGELSARSAKDGLTIDHIPSNASNVARQEAELGRDLKPAERAAVRDQGTAVAVPDQLHKSGSPTYGGKNTPAQIKADAANPQAAVARDTNAMVKAADSADKPAAKAAADALQKLHD